MERHKMALKGYRYEIKFADKNKAPLFAKTIDGVAKIMREDFPLEKGWSAERLDIED